MEDIFWGVAPFVLGEFVIILLLVLFPQIALWLPSLMP
jgi:TRAP-type mannitol/chloroaromatic compound transport system permease large subunit